MGVGCDTGCIMEKMELIRSKKPLLVLTDSDMNSDSSCLTV